MLFNLTERTFVTLCLHRYPRLALLEIYFQEGMPMLTVDTFIAVLSLCLTAFSIGYSFGNKKTQK